MVGDTQLSLFRLWPPCICISILHVLVTSWSFTGTRTYVAEGGIGLGGWAEEDDGVEYDP